MAAKLVYIVSAGHSGSTLSDLVAGSIPGVFSTGELTYLPWQLSRMEAAGPEASLQKLCSCHNGFRECPHWMRVLRNISKKKGVDICADPFRFRINLLQNEKYFVKRLGWERLQRLPFGIFAQTRGLVNLTKIWELALRDIIKNNWLLFDTIADVSGATHVVDSSKSEKRLKLLYSHRPQDMYVLILIRDIRGVAYSAKKLGEDPIAAASAWVRQYQWTFSTLRNMPDVQAILVRYESLAAHPILERRRMAGFFELADPGDDLAIDTRTRHLVAGNGMRHCGELKIRIDESWRKGLDVNAQRLIKDIEGQLSIPALYNDKN